MTNEYKYPKCLEQVKASKLTALVIVKYEELPRLTLTSSVTYSTNERETSYQSLKAFQVLDRGV